MKTKLILVAVSSCFILHSAIAATTIDTANRYAYAANLGWLDAVADTNNGAVIGEYVCAGNLYSANVGWINLGSGSPANQIQYQNNSATDYGVNQDGLGNLTGYAYSANVGWINFEQTYGQPKVNLYNGQLSGSYLGFGRAVYYNQIFPLPSILGSGVFVGASAEVGRINNRADGLASPGTLYSGSVFVGASTFAGPAYLGAGIGNNGAFSMYLLLGAP